MSMQNQSKNDIYFSKNNEELTNKKLNKLNTYGIVALIFGTINAFLSLVLLIPVFFPCDGKSYCASGFALIAIYPAVLNLLIFGILAARAMVKVEKCHNTSTDAVMVPKIKKRATGALILLWSPIPVLIISLIVSAIL